MKHEIELPEDAHHGILIFAAERNRAVVEEGYTPEHDDTYDVADLVAAGYCYIQNALGDLTGATYDSPPFDWPFTAEAWKPSDGDMIKDLRRGVQFLAAAIDNVLTVK